MATLSPFKVALAAAKALAMATGKVTTVTTTRAGAPVAQTVSKLIKPSYTPMEYQGNTAEDRAANNETEDDFVLRSYEEQDALDRRCDADARWFAGWYTEQHTARVASLGTAKRIAKKHSTDKLPARIKRVTTPKTVTYTHDYGGGKVGTWTVTVNAVHYEVYYMTKVCYAVEGDADFVPEPFEPGLLWSQVRDCSAEEALAE